MHDISKSRCSYPRDYPKTRYMMFPTECYLFDLVIDILRSRRVNIYKSCIEGWFLCANVVALRILRVVSFIMAAFHLSERNPTLKFTLAAEKSFDVGFFYSVNHW